MTSTSETNTPATAKRERLTVERAVEAVVFLYLDSQHKSRSERFEPVETKELAKYLGVSESTVRKTLRTRQKAPWLDGGWTSGAAVDGISHRPAESHGRIGFSSETWEPTKTLIAERLAAALALSGVSP